MKAVFNSSVASAQASNGLSPFQRWGRGIARWAALGLTSCLLFACVEINGEADVDAKGQVKVTTHYDFSKVFNNLKAQNPALSDRMEGFDCKIFVSQSPNFKCTDEGVLKYKMTDEQKQPVGVSYNEKTGEVSFDAVQFFAHETDLKSMVQRNSEEGALIGPSVGPLLPLQSARRQTYQNEGLSIVLKTHFANPIVSIDGQEVKNGGQDLTINFMDIADKQNYVIVTRPKAVASATWWFVLAVLALLALAVWFLWRKNKGSGKGPNPPANGGTRAAPDAPIAPMTPSAPNTPAGTTVATATVAAAAAAPAVVAEAASLANHIEIAEEIKPPVMDAVADDVGMESEPIVVDTPESAVADVATDAEAPLTKGQRIAQVLSAAAVGMGASAVGGGAHHTIEEVLVQEEPKDMAQAIVNEHNTHLKTDAPQDQRPAETSHT